MSTNKIKPQETFEIESLDDKDVKKSRLTKKFKIIFFVSFTLMTLIIIGIAIGLSVVLSNSPDTETKTSTTTPTTKTPTTTIKLPQLQIMQLHPKPQF